MNVPNHYLDDVIRLFDIPKAPAKLLKLLVYRAFQGRIRLRDFERIQLCDELKINRQTLANYTNILSKKNILKRMYRNEYQLNDQLFSQNRKIIFTQITVDYIDGERVISGSSP